ncbi:MAG: DNA polymerase III subunit delta [Bacteroidales bacterium]|nr:DNA polymerase III subunit delta [Bacteroidales bacterium]
MAQKADKEGSQRKFQQIMEDIRQRRFAKIYVLAGEEPYYADVIIEALSSTVLSESQKDFNFSVVYGNDTDAGQIVCLCRRYPVESEFQLIIVKEAQQLSSLQAFEYYLASPAPDTILVLSFTGKALDKRTGFYKKLKDKAEVLESFALDEWKVPQWITDYVEEKGYRIEQDAAQLLSQSTGSSLRKIVLEIDKLFKGTDGKVITAKDVEVNVGISRDYNPFELCKAIGEKNRLRCFEIAEVFANNSKKYPIQATLGAMFFYFNQLLVIQATIMGGERDFYQASMKAGVFGTMRVREYQTAARNYPLFKTMNIISLIKDCDLRSKSNYGGSSDDGALLNELLSKILI